MLTDVVMPQMSGVALSDRIRSLHPESKVIFTSGFIDDAIGHDGVLDLGITFLQKPYTPATLLRSLKSALDSQGPIVRI